MAKGPLRVEDAWEETDEGASITFEEGAGAEDVFTCLDCRGGAGNLVAGASYWIGGDETFEILAKVAVAGSHLDYPGVDRTRGIDECRTLLFEL